jgi:hypothetical protein
MMTQDTATHGLSRSPIRAAFQNTPDNPRLWLFMDATRGRKYAHVQMNSKITVSKLVKSKIADWKDEQHNRNTGQCEESNTEQQREAMPPKPKTTVVGAEPLRNYARHRTTRQCRAPETCKT